MLLARLIHAGQSQPPSQPAPSATPPLVIDGPPAPVPPEVITRDALGRATVRAVRLTDPLLLDGALDEAVYESVPPMSDFIQMEPVEGALATEKTEVWVFFDRDTIYVSSRCWDSHAERMIANDMRRDGSSVIQNENFSFVFDTFYNRRNLYSFEVTPIGGRMDEEWINDGQSANRNWNPVWQLGTGRFADGWTVEAAIPFKSLRYGPGTAQVWGFNAKRAVRWKNEYSYLTRLPSALSGRGFFKASLAATLVGLEVPTGSHNLEIKPYAVSSLASDATVRPRISNDLTGDAGVDVKYGVTKGLTADFTYNTDFAQVEADQQQVNLTRFSLFFPEKRDFFLENAGMFVFGGATGRSGTSGSTGDNTPILFYSRRIGLEGTQAVPILAGGRLTGRVGKFSVGALNIRADEVSASGVPSTSFTAVRLKRDVLRRSSIGAIFTGRSVDRTGLGTNEAYGVDGTFILTDTVTLNAFWAQTHSPGRASDDTSYRANFNYSGDRYGVQVERLMVGANFNPEVGFVRQPDLRRSYGQLRFSPRPARSKKSPVRKFYYTGTMEYIENGAGRVDLRAATGEFAIDFQNGDSTSVTYSYTHEFLPVPLRLTPGVVVPVGGYTYSGVKAGYTFGPQRKTVVANVSLEHGTFYNGHKTTLDVSSGLVSFPPHLMIEPIYSINLVNLPQGSFTTHLLGPRVTCAMTPLMFVSALLQYNSTAATASANVRFRWEYQPGSELFVVLNEQRDTHAAGFPAFANRSFIVKITSLFRF